MTNVLVMYLFLTNAVRVSWWAEPGFYDRLESRPAWGDLWLANEYVEEVFFPQPVCFELPKRGEVRFYRVRRLVVPAIKLYDGPWSCVCHPPCQRWGKFWFRQPLAVKRTGISAVRRFGGVVARMGLKRAKQLGEVGARSGGTDSTPRIHTPPAFRELLLGIAMRANAALCEGGEKNL